MLNAIPQRLYEDSRHGYIHACVLDGLKPLAKRKNLAKGQLRWKDDLLRFSSKVNGESHREVATGQIQTTL